MKHILPCGDHYQLIDCSTICYIAACQNYTKVYLLDDTMVLCSLSMMKLLDCLGSSFIQIHKSYIVNLSAVLKYYKTGRIFLTNGIEVPVSRRRQKNLITMWKENVEEVNGSQKTDRLSNILAVRNSTNNGK